MVLSLVFYAAATFEGSMLLVKTVNSLSHYTGGRSPTCTRLALGWVAMITIGSLYAMAPRALGRPAMYSHQGHGWHFRLHMTGTVMYLAAMWTAGVTERPDGGPPMPTAR